MLTNDAEALARGMSLFGGKMCGYNDIASGVENVIDRVCMYCKAKFGEKEGSGAPTHGICDSCMHKLHPEVLAASNVAPPGMEHVVRALKRQSGVDNPFAVAWSIYQKDNDIVSGLENK